MYLTVKKGNIFVNILLLKIFFADYCHLPTYLAVYLLKQDACELSDIADTAFESCKKG